MAERERKRELMRIREEKEVRNKWKERENRWELGKKKKERKQMRKKEFNLKLN